MKSKTFLWLLVFLLLAFSSSAAILYQGNHAGNGSGLTNLNSSELRIGTVPTNRLANIPPGVISTNGAALNQVLKFNGTVVAYANESGGGGGTATNAYNTIMEEGTPLTQMTNLNFIGVGITATHNAGAGRTDITLDADLDDLADGSLTGSKVGPGIAGANINTGSVLIAGLENIATDRLLGRDTAGSGAVEQLTVGGGVEFTGSGGIQSSAYTGDVIKSAGGTATTIAANAVTTTKILDGAVTENKLSLIDTNTANASTAQHGFLPKLSGNAATYLDGNGGYTIPSGLGDMLRQGSNFVVGSVIYEFSAAPNSGTNIFLYAATNYQTFTLTNHFSILFTNWTDNTAIKTLLIRQDGTGGWLPAWEAATRFVNSTNTTHASPPVWNTNAGVLQILQAFKLNGTNWVMGPTTLDSVLLAQIASGDFSGLTLQNLGGAVTDAQVPNSITVDLATVATTANNGDSATAFFPSGTIETARLGSGPANSTTFLRGDQAYSQITTNSISTNGAATTKFLGFDGILVSWQTPAGGSGEGSGVVHSGGALTRAGAVMQAADTTGTNVTTSGLTISGNNLLVGGMTQTNGVTNLSLTASSPVLTDADKKLVSGQIPKHNIATNGATLNDVITFNGTIWTNGPASSISNGTYNGSSTFQQLTLTATSTTNYVLDFINPQHSRISTTADIWFVNSTNRSASTNEAKQQRVYIEPHSADRTIHIVQGWKLLNIATNITVPATKLGIFSVECAGPSETNVTAAFQFQDQSASTYTAYASGTAYTFSATYTNLNFGTTDTPITIGVAGTYLIHSNVGLLYSSATYAGAQTVTIKLRRTNNTPADITNAARTMELPVLTTFTGGDTLTVPPVIYTATSGDILELYGSVSATPSAGTVQTTSAEIVAVRLY